MIRRVDRQIADEQAFAVLCAGEYGVLSTVCADGRPYGIPVSFCVIDRAIYFHCALEGRKLDNIAHSPQVSFCVVGATEVLPAKFGTRYESCVVEGVATEVFDGAKQRALDGLIAKYSKGHEEAGARYIAGLWDKTRVFRIAVVSATGKARR